MSLLKHFRRKKGYTQDKVADYLKITTRHYQRIESNDSFLSQDKLNKLENLFGLPQRILLAESIEDVPAFYKNKFDI